MRKKEERSKQGQTNNKAKQHSTPKAVTFPKKNELPRVRHIHVVWATDIHVNVIGYPRVIISSGTDNHWGYFFPSGCDARNIERGRQSRTMTSSGVDFRSAKRSCAFVQEWEGGAAGEGSKKEASMVIQTTRHSNTTHPRQ